MRFCLCFLLILSLAFIRAKSASAEDEGIGRLVEKGQLLVRQESYPAAIAALETVLKKDPMNARALDLLLSAYDAYSQKLMAQNRFEQARTYLHKMEALVQNMDTLPKERASNGKAAVESRIKRELALAKTFLLGNGKQPNGDILSLNVAREQYNQAVEQFNLHQYELAEELLKESIKHDSKNPYAYELLGEIANLNHQLVQAEEYYRKAFSLNPDPLLRAKLEKVIRERKIDKTQQQYSDEHFIIRYRRDENLEGSRIRDFLREAYRSVSHEFGYYPKYKIPVVLYDREEYYALMESIPHWSAAVFDGKIRIPIYGATGQTSGAQDTDLRKLIYHELTHAFVLDLSRMKCPVWLNEGLAQFQENRVQQINLKPLEDAVRTKSLISVEELTSASHDVSGISSPAKAYLFYLESFSFVSYVLKQHRFYTMKQLILELGKGAAFQDAFEKVFGRPFKEMTAEWEQDLQRRFA